MKKTVFGAILLLASIGWAKAQSVDSVALNSSPESVEAHVKPATEQEVLQAKRAGEEAEEAKKKAVAEEAIREKTSKENAADKKEKKD